MYLYTFAVYSEEDEGVYRVLEIPGSHTFEKAHEAIAKSFGLKERAAASFFLSNNKWQKIQEIEIDQVSSMENALDGTELTLDKFLEGKKVNLIYINDEAESLSFPIEIQKSDEMPDGAVIGVKLLESKGKLSTHGGFMDSIFGNEEDLYDDELGEGFQDEGED